MATIYDYLDKKREENPLFEHYSDRSLYRALKNRDPNLPSWAEMDTSIQQSKSKQKYYLKEQSPSFANSLYDWTDWGIDESSPEVVKQAYNQSITGMAYQLQNGTAKFNVDENWNPGIVEDIGAAVLSFAMPLDILSMFVGGWIGKAGLATMSGTNAVKNRAVKNLIAKGMPKEQASNTVAKLLTEKLPKAKLFPKTQAKAQAVKIASPIGSGAILQGATLATFEGARGGVQAAVNGEDVWDGIKDGVMHGGVMGGIAGAVGSSLNIVNAGLFSKVQDRALTTSEKVAQGLKNTIGLKGAKVATGIPGQVLTEGAVFTAPTAIEAINNDMITSEDLLREFVVNVGMMGVLKAKSKLVNKGMKDADAFLERYTENIKKNKELNEPLEISESIENISNELREKEGLLSDELNLKANEIAKRDFDNYFNPVFEKYNAEKIPKEIVSKFRKDVADYEKIMSKHEKGQEITIPDYSKLIEVLNNTVGFLEGNINYQKKNKLLKQVGLDALKRDIDKWDNEIFNSINDIDVAKRESVKPDITLAKNISMDYERIKQDALRKNKKGDYLDEAKANYFLKEVETEARADKEGRLTLGEDRRWQTLNKALQVYKSTYLREEAPKKASESVRKKFELEEDFKYRESKEDKKGILTPDEMITGVERKEIRQDITPVEAENLRKLYNKEKAIEADESAKTVESYNKYKESKDVLKYFSRNILPNEGQKPHLKLDHMNKFAKYLAEKTKPKSLLEVTDKDFTDFSKTEKVNVKEAMASFAKGMHSLKESYPNILAKVKEFKILSAPDVGKEARAYYERATGSKSLEGLMVEGGIFSQNKYRNSVIELPVKVGKAGRKIIKKYVTGTLSDNLKTLQSLTKKKESPPGHKDFLFKNERGKALTTDDVSSIARKIFGDRSFEKGAAGEGRLFRKSLSAWAADRLSSRDAKIVDKLLIGHSQNIAELYQYGIRSEAAAKKKANEILSKYFKDIKSGKFKQDPTNEGYTIQEIKKGLKDIDKIKDSELFTFKDSFSTEKNPITSAIDGFTLKTMFKYMLETGPRLNEIAPFKQNLKLYEKAAEKQLNLTGKSNYQLASEVADKIMKAEDIADMVKWVESRPSYKDIKVIEKELGKFEGKYVIGKLTNQLVEIAKGKATIDTIPHEISHYVVNALKSMGDGFSKNLVNRGVKLFKRKGMKDSEAEEALVDAIGKYTSNRIENKSLKSRMKSWLSSVMNYFRQKFGITNMNDVERMKSEIVSLLGEKVYKGKIPKDYMPSAEAIKVSYKLADTKEGYNNLLKEHNKTRAIMRELKQKHKIPEENIRSIIKDELGIDTWTIKEGAKNSVNIDQLWNLQTRLQGLYNGVSKGKSSKLASLESRVIDIEQQNNISEKTRNDFFKDIFNTTPEKATNKEIKVYRSYIINAPTVSQSKVPLVEMLYEATNGNSPSLSASKTAKTFMVVGDVLRKHGGKWGNWLSEAADQHDYVRTLFYNKAIADFIGGEKGQKSKNRISGIVDRTTRNNYMQLTNPLRAKRFIAQLEKLASENPNGKVPTNSKLQKILPRMTFSEELKLVKDIVKKFESGDFKEAKRLWNGEGGLTNFYWNSLKTEISKKTNTKEFDVLMEKLQQKYVEDYFSNRTRKELIDNIDNNHPQIVRHAKQTIKKLTKKELESIADKNGLRKGSLERRQLLKGEGDILLNHVTHDVFNRFKGKSHTVKPSFLKERVFAFDEYTEITLPNGKKKLIKSYETSLDAIMTHYALGMSRLLANVRLFPQFTEWGGKFSTEKGRMNHIVKMLEKDTGMGKYAYEALKDLIGMNETTNDVITMGAASRFASQVTNISATIGLSSPTSGYIKNVFIQIPRSAYLFGGKNTLKAIGRTWKIMNDPVKFEDAIRKGYTGYGGKTVLEESPTIGKGIKWWFNNANGMNISENFNRIMLAEAGKMHFNELLNNLRKRPSLLKSKLKDPEIRRYLKHNYRLTDKRIDWLVREVHITGTDKLKRIEDWVGFQSHKRGAGATGTFDLPIAMSWKSIKPFTLFQRIAASVTNDTYHNVVKPAVNGNYAPAFKYAIGHALSGAALFTAYDWLFSQQSPKAEGSWFDKFVSYLWRSEAFGLFGELISPYAKRGEFNPISEPVIVRNAYLAGENFWYAFTNKRDWDVALKDFSLKSVVLMGQLDKVWNKIKHPYVSDLKRLRVLENSFRKEAGEEKSGAKFPPTKRSPFYWKLKEAIRFGKSEEDVAKTYYAAFNYIVTELENGVKSPYKRARMAEQAIEASVKSMRPITFSAKDEKNLRRRFKKWLSLENLQMAEKLDSEWGFKKRKYDSIIGNKKWRELYSVYPY